MSGVGVVVEVGGAPVGEVVARMVGAVPHRGQGRVWEAPGVGVASVGGRPVVHEAAGVVVVADVRLDNRVLLVPWLGLAEGADDAEVILAAYLRWGAGCAARLLGDFAFVVWDARRRRLVAARDAMGMRALYWHRAGARVLVGTEIKQLLAAGVPARLFEPALAAYLAGDFSRLEWTCYEGIEALPPAHVLEVDERGARTWRYWELDPERRIRYRDEREYAEHLRGLFVEAVRARVRGPGPVGVMLSGGMDSGAVASTAGWLRERESGVAELRAYCWAFRELPACDERHISRGITQRYGIAEVAVEADQAWPLKDYPAHGPDRDEPYLGVYQPLIDHTLAAARADGVTTLLGGDRGDLVNGTTGWDYLSFVRQRRWRGLADEVADHAQVTGEPVPAILLRYLARPVLDRFTARPLREWPRRVLRALTEAPSSDRGCPPWIDEDLVRRSGPRELASSSSGGPAAEDAPSLRRAWILTPLHMRGMVWSERGYARHGLGFADPWSDRRLAEFAVAIPQQVLTRPGSTDKRLARAAMAGIMPEQVRASVRKIVPNPFYELALRRLATDTVRRLLDQPRLAEAGYVDGAALAAAYEAHVDGGPLAPEFWWALSLEMWLRQHMS
jgi:asparagine synthase (glutamine-hydrolysing)